MQNPSRRQQKNGSSIYRNMNRPIFFGKPDFPIDDVAQLQAILI